MNIAEIRAKYPQYSDLSDRELVKGLHTQFYKDMPYADFLRKIDFSERVNPTEGMSGLQKFNAGVGKAFTDLGRGAAQLVGMGPSAEEVAAQRELDKPLMQTGSGFAGNVAGNIAAFAPAAMIPGAATIPGSIAIGSSIAAAQPAQGTGDRLKNMGIGGAMGGATQWAGSSGANMLGERAGRREAQALADASKNSVRDQTLREGQVLGLSVPPSAVNPSTLNNVIESVGGKAATNQQFAKSNQRVVDDVARREASLAPNEAISTQALSNARKRVAGPYRELTAINQQAAADMNALKEARLDSKLHWQDYSKNQRAESYREAIAADQRAEALEQALEGHASGAGRPELVEAMRKARVLLAKNHNVDKATNVGTGSVDSAVLGNMLDRGAPLSGDLRTIAAFQQAFKQPMREASAVPNPGSNQLASVLAGGIGAGGYAAGGPMGILAGAAPFVVPPAARALQLSRGAKVQPDYGVGAGTKALSTLTDPQVQQQTALLARMLALPSLPTALSQ